MKNIQKLKVSGVELYFQIRPFSLFLRVIIVVFQNSYLFIPTLYLFSRCIVKLFLLNVLVYLMGRKSSESLFIIIFTYIYLIHSSFYNYGNILTVNMFYMSVNILTDSFQFEWLDSKFMYRTPNRKKEVNDYLPGMPS